MNKTACFTGHRILSEPSKQLFDRLYPILEKLVTDVDHVVLLSDHEAEEDEADVDNIMRILNLRSIRERKDLHYSITAELRRELSQRLTDASDGIRQSPRGDSVTEPTFGPSGRQLRLNC